MSSRIIEIQPRWHAYARTAGCLALLTFTGCSGAYAPHSFARDQRAFAGARTRTACLDLAIERRADRYGSSVLGYEFGNRCTRGQVIDLAQVKVVGRNAGAAEVPLPPFDPHHELRPLELDGRRIGSEAIAYPTGQEFAELCVDVASLVHQQPARWMCLARVAAPEELELQILRPEPEPELQLLRPVADPEPPTETPVEAPANEVTQ